MNLKYSMLLLQMRPRVIHRIPGRLRVHIPAIKKVNGNFHEISTLLLNGFRFPDNFKEVNVNYITGNILIKYEFRELTERDVLDWLFEIKYIVERIFHKFVNMDDDEIKIAHNKLMSFLQQGSKNGILLNEDFQIPNEIWN